MGYLSVWKVLEEMITDFRKKGIIVPKDVISELKYAKTLINVLMADPTCADTSQKVEQSLCNVESYLISEGQKFGNEYVKEWLKKLDEASKKVLEKEEEVRFIPGLPREQRWIRIKPFGDMPIEKLKELADELNLLCNVQSDGYVLICGDEENIKDFVKKVATKHGLKTENSVKDHNH